MFWALLAGIGACTNAAYYIANKKFLERLDPNLLAASGFFFTSVLLLGITFTTGIPTLGPRFFPAVIITAFLNILATTLTFRALSSSDISLAVPMLSFTPLFLIVTAALVLGEIPSAAGIAGIILIVAGSYILNTAAGHTRLMDPFRDMLSHPGVMAMLGVAFLYSITINFDKMVVLNSNQFFGAGIEFLLISISFAAIAALARCGLLPAIFQPPPRPVIYGPSDGHLSNGMYLLLAGIFTGTILSLEAVSINTAYLQQIVPYVIAIKRLSLLLIVLYGTVIFREKEIIRRLAGAGLMVAGAIIVLLFA